MFRNIYIYIYIYVISMRLAARTPPPPHSCFLEKLNENQMKQRGQGGVGRWVWGGGVNNTTLPRPPPSP